jgi:outer membrane biogenesis lipoprotein LolB
MAARASFMTACAASVARLHQEAVMHDKRHWQGRTVWLQTVRRFILIQGGVA